MNEIGTMIDAFAYDGIGVFDFGGGLETIIDDVEIWANGITIGANTNAGIAVDSDGAGNVRVVGNRIRGENPNAAGIAVNLSRGTFVAANDLRAIDPPEGDVWLMESTREVRVVEPNDTVNDDGTDNEVTGDAI